MLVSMTGFSLKTFTLMLRNAPVTVTISIKSVNSRFFETVCKLPPPLLFYEIEFIKKIKKSLTRGTVTLYIHFSNLSALKGTVIPSTSMVEGYCKAIQTMQQQYALPGTFTINDLIALPDVFEISEELLDESMIQQLQQALDSALVELQKERAAEGASLQKDIEERIVILSNIITTIEPRAVEVFEHRKKQLMQNISLFNQSTQEIKDQNTMMLYHQLEKSSIHEEIVRFKTHLHNFTLSINNKEPEKGKKLDFILQELLREINTLMAKCTDSDISALAINGKVELEKIREQIQNIV